MCWMFYKLDGSFRLGALRLVEDSLSRIITRNGDINGCGILRINVGAPEMRTEFLICLQDLDASGKV